MGGVGNLSVTKPAEPRTMSNGCRISGMLHSVVTVVIFPTVIGIRRPLASDGKDGPPGWWDVPIAASTEE